MFSGLSHYLRYITNCFSNIQKKNARQKYFDTSGTDYYKTEAIRCRPVYNFM